MNFTTFAPALRILIAMGFMRIATMGYLTPQQASEFTKIVMDFLTLGLVPFGYAAWAIWNARDVAQLERAAAIPEVKEIALKPTLAGTDLAKAAPNPKVTAK